LQANPQFKRLDLDFTKAVLLALFDEWLDIDDFELVYSWYLESLAGGNGWAEHEKDNENQKIKRGRNDETIKANEVAETRKVGRVGIVPRIWKHIE